jgi:uncharacterized membrane protein
MVRLGLVAAPDVLPLAEEIAAELPADLADRFPGVDWAVEVVEADPADPAMDSRELVEAVRREMLTRDWDLAIGLTELPLRAGRRPVAAHASATHGVGLVSVPALGALKVSRRLRMAVARVIEGLLGEAAASEGDRRQGRMTGRLRELASPIGRAHEADDDSIRFVSAVVRGNLRLLVGMVRANEPWRVTARLSRALVGALGVAAGTLFFSDTWRLADRMTWPRLVALGLLSIAAACVALVLAHGLWERAADPAARERVILFNVATACTIAIGVASLYVALFLITLAGGGAVIPPSFYSDTLGHGVGLTDYLRLAFLGATLATVGGALGSMVESDLAVRNAAHRFSGDDR